MVSYGIWDAIPRSGREAALRARYTERSSVIGAPRTRDGMCPLGVALRAIGIPAGPVPNALWVGDELVHKGLVDPEYSWAVPGLAAEFIGDWDSGRIPPDRLAQAIG